MFTITPKSISVFFLTSLAWILGFMSLYEVIVNFGNQWYWYVAACVYGITINELFSHQLCSHNLAKIDTSRWAYKIFTFLLAVDHCWGPIKNSVMMHRNHHMYSDQGSKDVLNWRAHFFTVNFMTPLNYIWSAKLEVPDKEQYYAQQHKTFN